jgi:hypothetical protein
MEREPMATGEEILKKIQAKIGEQNEVIREQQIQIQEQQARIQELEGRIEQLAAVENERNDILSKLSEMVE